MIRKAVILMSVAGLVACGGIKDQERNFVLSAEERAAVGSQVPDQAVRKLEADLRRAKSEGYETYAPQHYKKALEYAEEARELVKRRAPRADVTKAVVLGQRYLSNGTVVRKTVLMEMRAVFAQRDYLMSIGAPALYPGDYEDAVEEIADIISVFERGDKHGAITQRGELMKDMAELEVRTTLEKTLGQIKRTYESYEDQGFDELVPKTYELAGNAIKESEAYIATNTRDVKGIERAQAKALFEVNHLNHVAEAVQGLRKVSPEALESVVAAEEARLARVAESLGLGDIRDRSLDQQVDTLTQTIKKNGRSARR